MKPSLWLAIRLPQLAADIHQQYISEDQPTVLCRQGQVTWSSALATQQGIRQGMSEATAHALCSQLHVLVPDSAAETRALQHLAWHLMSMMPTVVLQPPCGLLLEAGSCLRLFSGVQPLLDRLHEHMAVTPYHYRIALGHTPKAAWHLTWQPAENSLGAATAADTHSSFKMLLAELPLDVLDIEPRQKERLAATGLRTLAHILALPRRSLGKRFGAAFCQWLAQLLGEQADTYRKLCPPCPFRQKISFEEPLAQTAWLLPFAEQLLHAMRDYLQQRQLATQAIRWHLFCADRAPQRLIIRRNRPCQGDTTWLLLTQRRLENVTLLSPVLGLALDCARPQPVHATSVDLFPDQQLRPDPQVLLEKLDTLPHIQLARPDLTDEHVPALAEHQEHPLNPFRKLPPADPRHPPLPLLMADPPRPLQQHQGRPLWQGKPMQLLAGEYRLHSHWWQQRVHREYHRAAHPDGGICLIFRTPDGAWWLEGLL